jgi:hypothetical protein
MKTERRHELQKNVLAERLGKVIQRILPYSTVLAWGTLIACLALLVASIWHYYRSSQTAGAWQEYINALASTDRKTALQDLVANRPTEAVGIWSQLALADADLGTGSQLVYENREEAEHTIKDAIESYKEVLDAAPRSTFLKQRAEFGCAQGHEMLGELSAARKRYERVIELGKTTALGKQAEAQLKMLKDQDVKHFYDWFIAQRPSPRDADGFGMPNLNNLPDMPDLNIPGLEGLGSGSGSSTRPSDEPGSPTGSTNDDSAPEGDSATSDLDLQFNQDSFNSETPLGGSATESEDANPPESNPPPQP